MIGLDTNVLVRYLAQDDPVQSAKATRLIEKLTSEAPAYLSIVAMVETVWVLDRAYGMSHEQIAASIEMVLLAEEFVVAHEACVQTATIALADGMGDFADTLVGLLGHRAGCSKTLTFDKKAARLPGFELVA